MATSEYSIQVLVRHKPKGSKLSVGIISDTVFGTLEECLKSFEKRPDTIRRTLEWLKTNGYEY